MLFLQVILLLVLAAVVLYVQNEHVQIAVIKLLFQAFSPNNLVKTPKFVGYARIEWIFRSQENSSQGTCAFEYKAYIEYQYASDSRLRALLQLHIHSVVMWLIMHLGYWGVEPPVESKSMKRSFHSVNSEVAATYVKSTWRRSIPPWEVQARKLNA